MALKKKKKVMLEKNLTKKYIILKLVNKTFYT